MIFPYLIHIVILICIFVILAVSLNLALGYTGMINLGHIAFYGIGAYASAMLTKAGWPFLGSIIVAALLAAVSSMLLTYITNRLKGDYFALGTLGFSFVVYAIMMNWVDLTRGPLGIAGIPKPEIFGVSIVQNSTYLIFALIVTVLVIVFLYILTRSRYGRLLEGVRDNAIGLSMLGKNVYKLKIQAMMISAALAAIAGSLYAHYITFIDPSTFYLHDLVIILTIVIVGGLASIKGSIVASIFILLIPELLRFLDIPPTAIGPLRQMLYAIILISILLFRPKGLFGKVDVDGYA